MTQVNPSKLPDEGFVRVSHIVKPYGPIPMSRAQWLQGVKDGRYPQPVKLSARITAWRVEDIRAFIQSF